MHFLGGYSEVPASWVTSVFEDGELNLLVVVGVGGRKGSPAYSQPGKPWH